MLNGIRHCSAWYFTNAASIPHLSIDSIKFVAAAFQKINFGYHSCSVHRWSAGLVSIPTFSATHPVENECPANYLHCFEDCSESCHQMRVAASCWADCCCLADCAETAAIFTMSIADSCYFQKCSPVRKVRSFDWVAMSCYYCETVTATFIPPSLIAWILLMLYRLWMKSL